MWLLWVAVDCCFGLALVRCSHSMDIQPAGMIFRRAAILSPLSHTRRRLPQALAAQRLQGQMVDPNPCAAGAESSRSMVPASVVRVDVPAGSIAHARAPQSDRTAHSACAALMSRYTRPTDGPQFRLSMHRHMVVSTWPSPPALGRWVHEQRRAQQLPGRACTVSSSACLTRGIGSLSAEPRRSTESWLYLYNMTCGTTHVSSVLM